MTCDRCYRVVVSDHTCDGDPRSTCCAYGCGRPIAETRLVETYGDGRRANLGYCQGHRFARVPGEEGAKP